MASIVRTHGVAALFVVALLVAGCGKKDQEPTPGSGSLAPAPSAAPTASQTAAPSGAQQMASTPSASSTPAPDMAQVEAQTKQALAQMNQGATVAALSPATVKGFLPAELPGFNRTDASAERTQMAGVDICVAEAQYAAAEGDGSIDVTITDVGNLSGPMKMGMTGWAMAQYNRETDTGYEKTTMYNGCKAVEEYDNESKSGALRIFAADRFVVEVRGSDVTMDAIKQAMGKIDLAKLTAAK